MQGSVSRFSSFCIFSIFPVIYSSTDEGELCVIWVEKEQRENGEKKEKSSFLAKICLSAS